MHHLLLASFIVVACWIGMRSRRFSQMPPGPPRSIWGDNRHQVPRRHPWKAFHSWKHEYGPIISFFLGGTPVVVLNVAQAAWDLLDARGRLYSSRPRFIIGGEILSGGMRGLGMPYGDRWRKWRKLMNNGLNSKAAQSYQPLQTLESKLLLRDLLGSPETHEKHFERYATSVMVSITYGRRIATLDDAVITANRAVSKYFTRVHMPGYSVVESFPVLLWLPRPLQWFRYEPERHRAHDTELYLKMMGEVEKKARNGVANRCLATYALDMGDENELNRTETAFALSAPFSAGVDTTVSSFEVFLLAMLHHPEVVKNAHRELDAIIGPDRLPEFSDEPKLPYINAIIKESLRWRPVAPLAAPHSVIADDYYNGMYIPKGSTVYVNLYAISQQEDLFPNPNDFKPERFLNTEENHLVDFDMCFGFGRRICPGLHVAMHTLFINVARILWAFDVLCQKDARGEDVLPDPDDFTTGLVVRPCPFNIDLQPRSTKIAELILKGSAEAEVELQQYN